MNKKKKTLLSLFTIMLMMGGVFHFMTMDSLAATITKLPIKDKTYTGERSYDIVPQGVNCAINKDGSLKYDGNLSRYDLQFKADDDLTGTWAAYDQLCADVKAQITNLSLVAPFYETIAFNMKLDDRLKIDLSKLTVAEAQKQFVADNPEWADVLEVFYVQYEENINAIHIYARFKPKTGATHADALQFVNKRPSNRMVWTTPPGAIYLPSETYSLIKEEDTLAAKGCISQDLQYVQLRSTNPQIDPFIPSFINNNWLPGSTVSDAPNYFSVIIANIKINCAPDNAPVTLKREKLNLNINKIVKGSPKNEDKAFDFNLLVDDESYNGEIKINGKAQTISDGKFKLKNGEVATVELLAGSSYKVTEADYSKESYSTEVKGNLMGIMDVEKNIVFTNTYVSKQDVPNKDDTNKTNSAGKVTKTKAMTGDESNIVLYAMLVLVAGALMTTIVCREKIKK